MVMELLCAPAGAGQDQSPPIARSGGLGWLREPSSCALITDFPLARLFPLTLNSGIPSRCLHAPAITQTSPMFSELCTHPGAQHQ